MEKHGDSLSGSVCPFSGDRKRRTVTSVPGCAEFTRKGSALFSSRVTKALYVGRSSYNSPSTGAKKTQRPREASVSKGAKKSTEGSSSGKENFDVDSV